MIKQQLDKRNVNDYIRTSLVLKMKSIYQEKAKANKVQSGKMFGEKHPKEEVLTNLSKPLTPVNTRAEVAKESHVSEGTVAKVEYIESNATDSQKEDLATDQTSIHKVYTELKKQEPLPVLPNDPLADIDDFDDYGNTCTYKPQLLKDQQGFELCPCGCGYAFYRFDKKWYSKKEWTDKYV